MTTAPSNQPSVVSPTSSDDEIDLRQVAGALSRHRRTSRFDQIKDGERMTRGQKVLGHWPAHIAQTQKRDRGHLLLR